MVTMTAGPAPVVMSVTGMVDIGDRGGGRCRFGHGRYRRRHRDRGERADHRDTRGGPPYRGRFGCREHTFVSFPTGRRFGWAGTECAAPTGTTPPRKRKWNCPGGLAARPSKRLHRANTRCGRPIRPTRSQSFPSHRSAVSMWPNWAENRPRVLGGNPDITSGAVRWTRHNRTPFRAFYLTLGRISCGGTSRAVASLSERSGSST